MFVLMKDDEQEKEDKRKAEQEVARIKLNLLQEQLDKAKEDNATLVKQNLELKQVRFLEDPFNITE